MELRAREGPPPAGCPQRSASPTLGAVSDRLLILWIALIGATRVDLLAGEGPFGLTPFLLLSPLVLGVEAWRIARAGWRPRIPSGTAGFVLAISAFLSLLLVSTFLAWDLGASARRFSLLLVQVGFVIGIAVGLANRADPARILVRGSLLGLGLCTAFSAAQLAALFTPLLDAAALGGVLDLEARRYFEVIPRLTGSSEDANLGAFLILFYLAVVWHLAAPSRLRSLALGTGLVLLAMTLSRSGLLGGLVLWALWTLEHRELRVGLRVTGVVAALLAAVTGLALLSPETLDPGVALLEILGHRLSPEEGSTVEHFAVVARGWEVGTESVKHTLVGLGYGNAFVALQDFFPGHEYGNFHSLFVTIFAESGAPAALVLIWVFVHALRTGGTFRPLVGGLLAFNLFQQAHADPWMWLILFLAWTGVGEEGEEGSLAASEADAAARPVPRRLDAPAPTA